jgi:hypothetical protein
LLFGEYGALVVVFVEIGVEVVGLLGWYLGGLLMEVNLGKRESRGEDWVKV